jgi:hypothetical protein
MFRNLVSKRLTSATAFCMNKSNATTTNYGGIRCMSLRSSSMMNGSGVNNSNSSGYTSDNENYGERGMTTRRINKVMPPKGKKSNKKRAYGTTTTRASVASIVFDGDHSNPGGIGVTRQTLHSPMRHTYNSFYEAPYYEEDYDDTYSWNDNSNLHGYIATDCDVDDSATSPFEPSAEQVLAMMDTSYYHASYRAKSSHADERKKDAQ